MPKASDPLLDEDIKHFYDLQLLGNANPESLLRTLHRNSMTYFGLRANEEHRSLCWGDVILGKDPVTKMEYIEYKTERLTKTRTGMNPRNKRQVSQNLEINLISFNMTKLSNRINHYFLFYYFR